MESTPEPVASRVALPAGYRAMFTADEEAKSEKATATAFRESDKGAIVQKNEAEQKKGINECVEGTGDTVAKNHEPRRE